MEPQPAGYDIVGYRPEHRDQVLQLQTHVWGSDVDKNSAYFDWKFCSSPCQADVPVIYLAVHEGRVVGMQGVLGTRWQVGRPSRILRCLSLADALIHPEHRRRGLYERITSVMLADLSTSQDYEYIYSLSSGRITSGTQIKLGWRSAGSLRWTYLQAHRREVSRVRKLARNLPVLPSVYRRLRSHVREALGSSSTPFTSAFARLDAGVFETVGDNAVHIRVEKKPRPGAMAELVERIGHDGRLRQLKDQKFLAWRFENPLSQYRFLFWDAGRLEGYLVLETRASQDGRWITVVDWEATDGRVWADLIRTVARHADYDVLTIWSATLHDDARSVLEEEGFRAFADEEGGAETAHRPTLLIRPLSPEQLGRDWIFADRRLLDMSNWDLRPSYSDAY